MSANWTPKLTCGCLIGDIINQSDKFGTGAPQEREKLPYREIHSANGIGQALLLWSNWELALHRQKTLQAAINAQPEYTANTADTNPFTGSIQAEWKKTSGYPLRDDWPPPPPQTQHTHNFSLNDALVAMTFHRTPGASGGANSRLRALTISHIATCPRWCPEEEVFPCLSKLDEGKAGRDLLQLWSVKSSRADTHMLRQKCAEAEEKERQKWVMRNEERNRVETVWQMLKRF